MVAEEWVMACAGGGVQAGDQELWESAGTLDVKLKRNPWTGQMIYADARRWVASQWQHNGWQWSQRLGWSTDGKRCTRNCSRCTTVRVGDVQRLVDAAWGPVEDQMGVQGDIHDDIVPALGRHAGCLSTLHKTIWVVQSGRAEGL